MSENDPELNMRAQLLRGDTAGLTAAFSLYGKRLKQTVKLRLDKRLRGRLDESDVLQESFLVAVKELPSYSRDDVSVFVWLHRLTTRRLTDLHREHLEAGRRALHRESLSLNQPANADRSGSDWVMSELLVSKITPPSQEILQKERVQFVFQALNEMDAVDREVLMLRHFEMLSNDETAGVLGISVTAASNRYVRALKRMNQILADVLDRT